MAGVCMATLTAIFTVSLPRANRPVATTTIPEVVTLAAHLMLLAAVYQISDSIQVIGSGILRGYKDTRSIFYITFTAYWVLGLPSGYILALTDLVVEPMGPAGFWSRLYYWPDVGSHYDDAAYAGPGNVCRQPSFCNEHPANKDKAQPSAGCACVFTQAGALRRCHLGLAVISESYTEFARLASVISTCISPVTFPFHIDEVR